MYCCNGVVVAVKYATMTNDHYAKQQIELNINKEN